MIKYNTKLFVTDIEYNNNQITVEYNFVKAERSYFDGTGTFDGVDINKILIDNVDVTNIIHHEYADEIESMVLKKHKNL